HRSKSLLELELAGVGVVKLAKRLDERRHRALEKRRLLASRRDLLEVASHRGKEHRTHVLLRDGAHDSRHAQRSKRGNGMRQRALEVVEQRVEHDLLIETIENDDDGGLGAQEGTKVLDEDAIAV